MPNGIVQSAVPHAADRVVLPVARKAMHRARFVSSAMQDVPVALTLISAGVAGFASPGGLGDRTLALVEIAASAWLLVLTARTARALFGRKHEASDETREGHAEELSIDWPLVAGAALALVEVWQTWRATGHIKRPTLLVGIVSLGLALGGRRLIARRIAHRAPRLVISRGGVDYRASRRYRFRATWDEIATVERAPGALRFSRADGAHFVLAADDHFGGAALVTAASDALRAYAPTRLLVDPMRTRAG